MFIKVYASPYLIHPGLFVDISKGVNNEDYCPLDIYQVSKLPLSFWYVPQLGLFQMLQCQHDAAKQQTKNHAIVDVWAIVLSTIPFWLLWSIIWTVMFVLLQPLYWEEAFSFQVVSIYLLCFLVYGISWQKYSMDIDFFWQFEWQKDEDLINTFWKSKVKLNAKFKMSYKCISKQ